MRAVLPLAPPRPSSAEAVDHLIALLRHDLGRVNALILERMKSDVPLIPQLAAHLIEAGGKRLRPMLTLAAARLCGYEGDHHIKLAAAVEFIHTATLLHDDVVDQSKLRRGRPTANIVWGNSASVLVGDFLFSRSFQLMVEAESVEILGILANASAVIAEGEVMQLSSIGNLETSESLYLQVVAAKTAALFEAAAKVGAVAARRSAGEVAAMAAYGLKLGIAFQLVDDALDYSGRQAAMGKDVGDDFREGKVTLPAILAFARAGEEEKSFWRRTISDVRQSEGDLSHAIALVERSHAITDTLARARRYAEEAKAALDDLPDNAYAQALLGLADFCIARAY